MQSRELVKLYYRIGEVSEIVGVQPHVLRYWETEFRSIRPQKSSKGQRVYSRRDVEKLLRVKDLLRNQGFTIAGARKRLSDSPEAAALAPAVSPAPVNAPALVRVEAANSEQVPDRNIAERSIAERSIAERSIAERSVPDRRAADQRVADHSVLEHNSRDHKALDHSTLDHSAKDVRKALLGLRQDLMRMLDQLSALQARERGPQ